VNELGVLNIKIKFVIKPHGSEKQIHGKIQCNRMLK
jgi:hypothetical protein